jgi:hypothetical protein
VLVPGSMGTGSWVLAGTDESMLRSLGSTCHGAGRVWSRSRAKKEVRGDALRRDLEARGITVRAGSLPGLAEEAPSAYKDVDEVVETVVQVGIAVKVARLRPCGHQMMFTLLEANIGSAATSRERAFVSWTRSSTPMRMFSTLPPEWMKPCLARRQMSRGSPC